MCKKMNLAVAAAVVLLFTHPSNAAIMYSTPGSPYSQNFDSLPNTPTNTSLGNSPAGWTDDNASPPAGNFSIVGWYLHHPITQAEGGADGHQRMRLGTGSANTGSFWSFGAANSTERALGMVSSNTMSDVGAESYYGARITNNTGEILRSFTLSYTGEQWRDGGTTTRGSIAQSNTFDYSLNATSIQDALATFIDVPALDFVSPTFGATTGAGLDGNAAANRTATGPVTVSGLIWAPGTDLWIRWTDINNSGNDHGLAIDDLEFSALIPEPSSLLLLGLAAIGLVATRRTR